MEFEYNKEKDLWMSKFGFIAYYNKQKGSKVSYVESCYPTEEISYEELMKCLDKNTNYFSFGNGISIDNDFIQYILSKHKLKELIFFKPCKVNPMIIKTKKRVYYIAPRLDTSNPEIIELDTLAKTNKDVFVIQTGCIFPNIIPK